MLFGTLACHLRYALLVMIAVLVIIFFSKWTGSNSAAPGKHAATSAPVPSAATTAILKDAKEYTEADAPNVVVALMQITHALALFDASQHLGYTPPPAAVNALKERQRAALQHMTSTYPQLLQS